MDKLLKIGALAKKTGLTVRTLHYYEEIGVLVASSRSEKGYRLYGREEIERLQKILLLQQLGFSLEEIGNLLDNPDFSLSHVVDLHVEHLEERLGLQEKLLARLKSLSEHLRGNKEISIDEFILTIEVTVMYEKYYSEEQLETLKQRRDALGEDGMQKAQDQWAELISDFQIAMAEGIDPGDKRVQALVDRQQELIQAFTGCDAGIMYSLKTIYKEEGVKKASQGMMDAELFQYMGRAREGQ